VFGYNTSVYDIQRAIFDGTTVPICCESRLARLVFCVYFRPRGVSLLHAAPQGFPGAA